MIIGKDLLDEIQIDINFSDPTLSWEDGIIPMKPADDMARQSLFIKDDLEEDLGKILDAKYEKADLPKIVSEYTHISIYQNNSCYDYYRNMKPYSMVH